MIVFMPDKQETLTVTQWYTHGLDLQCNRKSCIKKHTHTQE